MDSKKKLSNAVTPVGRAKGGVARKQNMTAERLSEIGKLGAEMRRLPRATHGSVDTPLMIGNIEIVCYVLEDGRRVLAQRGLQSGIGMSEGGGKGARKIAALMARLEKKGINVRDLVARANSPIRFIPPHGGNPADGYEATILPDICDVLIAADRAGVLDVRLSHLAERAAILQHGFASLGIIALVDEATGYQEVRPQDALQAFLEKIISKELAAWVKKFPDEFYENIYKLKGWPWPGMSKNRYSVVGLYTRDLVFERIAPSLLPELEKRLPKNENGNRPAKLHQHLTEDVGNPMLAQHLHSLVMLQRVALNSGYGWQRFIKMVDAAMPKKGDTLELPLGLTD
jgi:hypothetical protein